MSLQYQLPEEGGYGSIVCRFHINCDAASLQTLQSLPGDTFQLALWQQDQLSRTLYIFLLFLHSKMIFPDGSSSKKSACNAGDSGLIPGSGRSPGEGNGYPLQYSCLENSMDRGAWWTTVHGVENSWTRLK